MIREENRNEAKAVNGANLKIGIVVGVFNEDITGKLRDGAVKVLKANGVTDENIVLTTVPGGFELPLACQRLARAGCDGVIAIACIIKGETDHYQFIAGETTRGAMDVSIQEGVPVGNAILTVHTLEQAQDRTGIKEHAGENAARAVLSMLAST